MAVTVANSHIGHVVRTYVASHVRTCGKQPMFCRYDRF